MIISVANIQPVFIKFYVTWFVKTKRITFWIIQSGIESFMTLESMLSILNSYKPATTGFDGLIISLKRIVAYEPLESMKLR